MKKHLISIFLIYSSSVMAHGDHSAPGALPFAPHGGKVGTAEHADKDAHTSKEGDHAHEEGEEHEGDDSHEEAKKKNASGGHEESELYFEAVFDAKANQVEIFPLRIEPKSPNEFTQKSPSKDFPDLKAQIEFPRSQVFLPLSLEIIKDERRGEYWKAKVPFNKDIRFYVHLVAMDNGEKKSGKIHLEKRR